MGVSAFSRKKKLHFAALLWERCLRVFVYMYVHILYTQHLSVKDVAPVGPLIFRAYPKEELHQCRLCFYQVNLQIECKPQTVCF